MTARRYALVFIAVTALLAGVVAAFNLAVDPYGVLGTGWLAPPETRLTNFRVRTMRAYFARERPPNVAVFGSSRAMGGFRAEDIAQVIPGAQAHVFGYQAGFIGDHLAVLGRLVELQRAPETVILLLDADILGREVPAGALDTRHHPAVSGEDRVHFALTYLFAFPSSTAWRIAAAGIAAPAAFRPTPAAPERAPAVAVADLPAPAGPPAPSEPARGTPPANPRRGEGLPQGADVARAIAQLRAFVRLCDAAGIRLVVLMSPLRAGYRATLENAAVDAVVARVAQVAPVWTFDEAGAVGMERYWLDGSHFTRELGRLMLARAFALPAPADGRVIGRLHDGRGR